MARVNAMSRGTQAVSRFNFDCVFYYVSDMERAISFYVDVLGLPLVSRDPIARFDIDGVLFELVPTPHLVEPLGGGNARLCLRVDNIHNALTELRTKGIHTSQVQDKGKGLLASFEDPDGNELCLWQEKPSVAL
jgi:catechol 2,3-dioxygenase-like lactoylglutathione lyase family enzyme